jgi:hypothetical protein
MTSTPAPSAPPRSPVEAARAAVSSIRPRLSLDELAARGIRPGASVADMRIRWPFRYGVVLDVPGPSLIGIRAGRRSPYRGDGLRPLAARPGPPEARPGAGRSAAGWESVMRFRRGAIQRQVPKRPHKPSSHLLGRRPLPRNQASAPTSAPVAATCSGTTKEAPRL